VLRRTVFKGLAIGALAAAHFALPRAAVAETQTENCGQCMGVCPSIWEYDSTCHTICSAQSLGWCPASGETCGPWQVKLECQGDPI
jgi:hypothetical protein